MACKKLKKLSKSDAELEPCNIELEAPSNIEIAGEHQVDYGANTSSNESDDEGEGKKRHKITEVEANTMPPPKPPSEDGQEPPPTITYSYDDMVIPATVTYVAYKCHSTTIWEVILKVIGSEKERTASQIEYLQSVHFDEEDWLIAMHDAKVISLIRKLFSHGAQFRYHLYTRWATKTQGNMMEPFVTWPLIQSELAQVAADKCEAAREAARETAHKKSACAERDALDTHLRHSPLMLLLMRDGKRRFKEVKDDDSAQFLSLLTNSHNTSPVARLPPAPHASHHSRIDPS